MSLVSYAVADSVATITLDSPANRNALSRQLVTELLSSLDAAAEDASVKVVVLTSADRVFCSGADLSEASTTPMIEGARAIIGLQRAILALPKPVIVALRGPVRAGGTGIVAAADIVIASDQTNFQLTEVKLGLAPAAISLTLLPRLGSRQAAYTFLAGQKFGADYAASAGLVTKAVAAAELDSIVEAAAAEIVTGSAQGLRETKRLLNAAIIADIDARGEEIAALSARLFDSPEAHEAMTAFLSRGR
ncbi:enoyl-CoA hydratase-related protein [Nocardioides sp. Kera G14]|uniref:enoyl-CoA hydratase-related protein n=1 Tax=Nocardioides sp. Kera G14 TaxID=2884264 RepID=UPI001D106240|nr:enoyl-CoA hydratase-related protein [Nocardioides sp. Kera G14]UDY23498.1 enoyl-CoA hydratase/isomerase family protein [Nocardioides sp. Kera G14]